MRTYAVLVPERHGEDGRVSIPVGPDALGYLAETPEGYMFVNFPGGVREPHGLPADFEESFF